MVSMAIQSDGTQAFHQILSTSSQAQTSQTIQEGCDVIYRIVPVFPFRNFKRLLYSDLP